MRQIPRAGELYRHFKGNLYQIVTTAQHTETEEILVIYQALYGDFKVYARPLTMYLSEVDSSKYPDVVQKYRFELIEKEDMQRTEQKTEEKAEIKAEEKVPDSASKEPELREQPEQPAPQVDKELMRFLEAETSKEKLELLLQLKNKITERLLDNIAASLDIVIENDTMEGKYESLINCLQMKAKFETSRFR